MGIAVGIALIHIDSLNEVISNIAIIIIIVMIKVVWKKTKKNVL